MIIKKVLNPDKSASKSKRIARLLEYVREPASANSDEKCIYAGARGFITDLPDSQTLEMIALSRVAVRSKDTVSHYVLSWREGEHPTVAQVEEAVTILLHEFGLADHQCVYGLHSDTDNLHLHVVVNRVHPESEKVIEINRGFDIEAAHRAIAKIEHAQGWQPEQNARYVVLENGEVGREHVDPNRPRQPNQRKRDMENRTGEKSAERIAIEEAAPIIEAAKSWQQLHRELFEKGMRYEKFGSGAKVFVGEVALKASNVSRQATLSKLERRLGPFQPSRFDPNQKAAPREPEPIKQGMPRWDEYIAARKAHYSAKNDAKIALDRAHDLEKKALLSQQKARRDKLFAGSWKGRGVLLLALRSGMAAEQAGEKAAMKEKHKRQREHHRKQFRPFPDFEVWLRLNGDPELAEKWRQRESDPASTENDLDEPEAPPTPRDIRDFSNERVGANVHYVRASDVEEGVGSVGVSFIDTGKRIDVYDWKNENTTLAVLQLSAQKWGSFVVNGTDEYKAMCVKLAAAHGFKITNPELQDALKKAREQIKSDRLQSAKPEALRQFELYAESVGADRYRVTSIKMRADGTRQTFILDKKDGVTEGFTVEEVAAKTPEMQRLQRRGENLYYTPLSKDKHHVLVDDMSREQLQRMVADGYQPAVILESSPGNFQAIITVKKLGTPHDKDVGNRLAEYLNRAYGDAKLSGCIHPHRAPGYENRKPKHQRDDGSYPEVRLRKAEARECVKTMELARQIDADYQKAQQASPLPQERKQRKERPADPPLDLASGEAVDAYQLHYRDVLKLLKGKKVDFSRIDSMIAVRMRVTGHDQAAIEAAIRQCAPVIRMGEDGGRDWGDYAARTAKYAFSGEGERKAASLEKYRRRWQKLEGRAEEDVTRPKPR